jgi:outer membrane protein TolC
MNSIYEADDFISKDINLEDIYLKINQSKKDIEKAVEYAKSSYELGLVDLMYLLNAQQQLHNISIQENKILSDRYKNKIDLILSIGGSLEYKN